MNPDRLAELEEERRFLLRSLGDLEREREAGDVDDHDYVTLRDGYVARAAAVMRAIDEGRAALPRRVRRPGRAAAWVVGTVAAASLAGWAVAHSSGQRLSGQTMTGGLPSDQVALKLSQARTLLSTDQQQALASYQEVLVLDPRNVEAITYTGWLLVLQGSQNQHEETIDAGIDTMRKAVQLDPDYADPHCLLAVALGRMSLTPNAEAAIVEAQTCLRSNPPAQLAGLIDEFLGDLTSTTVAAATTTSGG